VEEGGVSSTGHLFVIQGDVTKLRCDAWLLPTDAVFEVTEAFRPAFGL